MTRVAVVVACYNDGSTLGETLASLERQEPHELVVVDDGSTESSTLTVLEELAATGVRVVSRENGGLSAARMTGVAATSAPYLIPLDADDQLAPGAVTALADALDADQGAALAWGDVEIFGYLNAYVRGAAELDPWLLTYLDEIPVAALVRRQPLLDAGGWKIRGYEDWDLWLAFAERGYRGVYVPVPTLRYRREARRMSGDCLDRHGEMLALLRSRHEALFACRRSHWRRSRAPWRVKVLFPLIAQLPMRALDRHRLFRLVSRPGEVLRKRRTRLRLARLLEQRRSP